MRFKMLGPLEVTHEGRPIVLGGVKQRAALGFLLLHPNQVVSTSQLLRALWSVEGAPATARKILQNAIWGLRRALDVDEAAQTPATLRTQSPGYALQVDRDLIDHHQFLRWVGEGRAKLAAGAPEEASLLLRDALGLWRGPALSDLAEAGVLWPELTTLQDTRLGVQEDFFEAQLACGQHYTVLSELEVMVDNEPLRERSCGQLMRALYRCGRQADALGVYRRLRAALVEDLGLEPSRELQVLQQSILTHDPALQLGESGTAVLTRTPAAPFAELPEPSSVARPRSAAHPEPAAWQRRRASILLVGTAPSSPLEADGPDVAPAFDTAAARVRQEIEESGGVFAGAMGGVSLGFFPAEPYGDQHAERAVRTAVALRDLFTEARERGPRESGPGVDVRVAVATGEALVQLPTERGAHPGSVNGVLLHECQALLPLVPAGEVQVCAHTHAATQGQFAYQRVAGAQESWRLRSAAATAGRNAAAGDGNGGELDLLVGLLEHTRRWRRPHQAIVLGASEAARGRMLTELRDRLGGGPNPPLVLSFDGTRMAEEGPYVLHRRVVAAYCGLTEQDSPTETWKKLEAAVGELAQGQGHANWLLCQLGPAPEVAEQRLQDLDSGERRSARRQFIEEAAQRRPLVLINNAVHRSDDVLQEFLEDMERTGRPLPLLAVTGARPEVSVQDRYWLGSKRFVTTITLDAPSDTDTSIERLTESQLSLALEGAPRG
ncbi:BTAD domain-containing putative transcriptional regulator [Streptomyces boluensis]|uniref:BTAD domain-containing putative transcriptional regulator n=1 Tax=Streptomyces boluensis TaxID=1775135 RepID=UPI001FE64D87|nr:BTAD domain-containing putative transcriptional regulator [Streptomyces boluensis]